MDFAFSDEQEQLRAVVRKYLGEKSPEAEVRRLMATVDGYDDVLWKDMAQQLGLQGIAIPERYGGSGFGVLELSVILEEMGRALVCAPYLSTVVLAGHALLAADDEAAREAYLPAIASGDLVATVAVPAGFADESAVASLADGDGYVLDGVAAYVLDGHVADLVLVPASVAPDAPPALFAISSARALPSEVLSRTPLPALDETRKLARLEFHRTPARMVGPRLQFGRPIGTFQAVKHKCVDMLVDLEAAKALAYYAAWTAETNAPELAVMSSLAKAECSDAARTITAETLHVHGGIGFTWEHPAHLYLKRAACSALLFGDSSHHRELVCRGLGI